MKLFSRILYDLLANILGLLLITWLFDDVYISPTVIELKDKLKILLLAAVLLAFINTFIKPILKIIAFPIALLTLGLFYFVLNAFILGFITWMIPEFHIDSLMTLVVAAFILSVINNIEHKIHKH
jgi:putative membrane protein